MTVTNITEGASADARAATILLLDDDRQIAQFVKEVLEDKEKFRVEWAPDIESALTILRSGMPDLALIDIRLQGETGWDFLRDLRSRPSASRIPVVMFSASDDVTDREKSLHMGADRYIVKPVTAVNLRRVISELLSARDDLWWTMSMTEPDANRIRELLYDTTTEIPTLALVVEHLRNQIEQGEELEVYCLELEPLFRMGERSFWDSFDALRREFVRGMHVVVGATLGNEVFIATSHSGANDFYFFLRRVAERNPAQMGIDLEASARALLRTLQADPAVIDEVAVFAGGTTTQTQPIYAPRILYNAVREAKDIAERRESRHYQVLGERLRRSLRDKTIRTVFQPILDLNSGKIIGHEALSRGPAGSEIESPEVIFELARDMELVWDLETVCIENIRPLLDRICSKGLLFFNLESHFIQQLHQRGLEALELFLASTNNVVIEVTERSAIRDYRTFRQTLQDLKHMGFRIAIDDCGSGYATLEAVAELRPDYLKVGHSLFQGVESDPIRRQLVGLVARCADSIGAKTIAEAIETEEQLRVCRELNIQYGQGYLFARPQPWAEIEQV
ncbi:MAG TPA: EAL domain-containing response regulator [Thermoanaerobaculia bacterium]|nr:EAL domain-containing response regulator [Thermoanaerobaculia bacterium]